VVEKEHNIKLTKDQIMKENLKSAILGACIIVLTNTGCSAFRSPMQTMNINCNPSDCILMVNGQRYTPPAQISVKRNRDVSIQCYKDGYAPYQRTIGNHFNDTGVLDAIGTWIFILPGIGLFTPGAWSLDETDVTIALYQR
jgi:hypothetical protein